MRLLLLFYLSLMCLSCSGAKGSQNKQWKEQNARKERIYRLSSAQLYPEQELLRQPSTRYPWEKQ